MAPWGSLVRMVAQAAIPIFRAFATAYQQALQNARGTARDGGEGGAEAEEEDDDDVRGDGDPPHGRRGRDEHGRHRGEI
ncbi:hypothetical protein SO694_0003533 [Aureococcus anophagefferens]|uniref:Uncharacterized protein n=1 Tax=Aureococcus anophagefferens TaxID=44056 RepID=A0ABR1FKR8_AURAN